MSPSKMHNNDLFSWFFIYLRI
ncbi:unnamed protein product [Spirodela intermedia]|uniref:Uncharacterized protein n=1 Tax=Spirodela intermedia TaxID=51605 RepID=A0A7I8KFP3_SPIIN|nr:unnamed protein product [Spirodela intermedia]